jgi:photosystem II stability/assembly factor-like uncharacterized protein
MERCRLALGSRACKFVGEDRSKAGKGVAVFVMRRGLLAGMSAVVLALVGAGSASAAQVSVGHSGWLWGSPTPQGQPLAAVVFDGATGYAVGRFGTAVKSLDGGQTWSGLPTGTTDDLDVVQEISPTAVVVGGGCSVRESTDGGASFVSLPINASENQCPTNVASVSFLSPSSGYVELTDGSVLFTDDTGQTVQAKTNAPVNNGVAAQIDFASPTTGFAVSAGQQDSRSGGGVIERTTDSASSWTQVGSATHGLNAIAFVNPTTAFAVGDNDTVLESTDGGATWPAKPLVLPAGSGPFDLTHISCSDPLNCLISTADGKELIRTNNGAMTGSIVTPSSQTQSDVAFSTGTNVVGVGNGGATVLSADGGQTFPMVISTDLSLDFDTGNPTGIRTGGTPGDAFVAGMNGGIAATTNGGESWSLLRVPTAPDIEDVAFPSTANGFEVGSDGELRKTTDGGTGWQTLAATVSSRAQLAAPTAATVLLIGPHGIRRSTDGGHNFKAVGGKVLPAKGKKSGPKISGLALDASLTVGRDVFAWGSHALYESVNGGSAWRSITLPAARGSLALVSFISTGTGYVVRGGNIYFTRNRGGTWTQLLNVGFGDIHAITFSSASAGLISLDTEGSTAGALPFGDVDVLQTSNGGKTWQPEVIDGEQGGDIAATPGHDYFADSNSSGPYLLATSNGGASPQQSTLSISIGAKKLTAKALAKKHNRVALTGKLNPVTSVGEQVLLCYRTVGKGWHEQQLNVASNGAFNANIKNLKSTTDFVVYAVGDGVHGGAGTPTAQLTVNKR